MTARFVLDPKLQAYATEGQWEYLTAWQEYGSVHKAAKVKGCSSRNFSFAKAAVLKKAARQGYAPEFDLVHPVPEGMTSAGVSILYDEITGKPVKTWNKSKPAGRDPSEAVHLPDPKLITKTATLYDQAGNVTQQWVSEKPEDLQRERLWREFAAALAADMPRVEAIAPPKQTNADLCACYPVGDHHIGMLSWDKETGEDYDLKIAEAALINATDHLIALAPPCDQALVVFLGDLMHFDSFEAVTPTSRNHLDSDGRFPKLVRTAIRAMRYLIEAAAKRHAKVQVIIEIGNHDLSSSIFLMECLRNLYENDKRIAIDTSPMHYHYFDFGKNLIGTHHGHGAKLANLPLIMATDRPAEWGRTKHRYIWTGHVHHDQSKDHSGVKVESFRVLATEDAWAHQKGYRSKRDMKSIILHREHGEVARHTVNPGMFA